jgi:uncharacterized membrane protein
VYAHTIMRGLGCADDRTFIGAVQAIDSAIINPWFMLVFVGALLFTIIAAVLRLSGSLRGVLVCILAALVLYLVAFVITVVVNVSLNDAIKAAGDPGQIDDLAGVRRRFKVGLKS